ncbi:MAG TPA: YfiR family protein [Allosphingosinicella sp.]
MKRPTPFLLALTLFGAPLPAQPPEDVVKADFLPKFARYVTWPEAAQPAAGQPFQLCMIGRDPFGPPLDRAAAGEAIDGHGVAVRRMESAAGAQGCHMAFVQGADPAETGRLLNAVRTMPVLTVTDGSGPQRGMIHFTMVGGRVRFFIDQASALQRGLTISSRLLALAAGVRQRR